MPNEIDDKYATLVPNLLSEISGIKSVVDKLIEKTNSEKQTSPSLEIFVTRSVTPKRAEIFDKLCDKCNKIIVAFPNKEEQRNLSINTKNQLISVAKQLLDICHTLQTYKSYITFIVDSLQNTITDLSTQNHIPEVAGDDMEQNQNSQSETQQNSMSSTLSNTNVKKLTMNNGSAPLPIGPEIEKNAA